MSILNEILNVIDTIPSWGRNLAAGQPVFQGTFDPSQRATEEDVLRRIGIPSNFGTRFLAGMATDPLTWLGGAGLAAGAVRGAAKTGARQAARGLGADMAHLVRSQQGSVPDVTRGTVAYHGSPHRFEKFTTKAMGTGEGAQTFGWGLYFADEQDVAKSYRRSLTGGAKEKPGVLYKARLAPKDDEYLLWSEPFEKQSSKVQSALRDIEKQMIDEGKLDFAGKGSVWEGSIGSDIYEELSYMHGGPPNRTGLLAGESGAKGTSLLLRKHGIRGNKFPDQFSRGADVDIDVLQSNLDDALKRKGELPASRDMFSAAEFKEMENSLDKMIGNTRKALHEAQTKKRTYNYVIFDEADISIEQLMSMLAAGGISAEIARQMMREQEMGAT